MTEPIELLERRIDQLRGAVREAVLAGDKARASTLRADLKRTEQSWEAALAEAELGLGAHSQSTSVPASSANASGPLLPLREQVYEALSLLQVPTAPKLIATVHEAFFATTFPTTRVTSLRRDEERSFRTAPFARPYYICAALTADFLSPSRGLLAVSTWPMEMRVIGSLSPRVDFLMAAIRVAEAIERIPSTPSAARRLLWRFAASIPGAVADVEHLRPVAVRAAAEAVLPVHEDADARTRRDAAIRARQQLTDAEQLFGSRSFRSAAGAAGEGRRPK